MKPISFHLNGRVSFRSVLAVLAAVSVGVGALRAEGPVTISENNRTQTIAAGGREVSILGDGNKLTLTGDCPALSVKGNKNEVSVQAVGSITTPGNNNRVTWTKALGGDKPQVSNVGSGNAVSVRPE